jgi:hypothetical protein
MVAVQLIGLCRAYIALLNDHDKSPISERCIRLRQRMCTTTVRGSLVEEYHRDSWSEGHAREDHIDSVPSVLITKLPGNPTVTALSLRSLLKLQLSGPCTEEIPNTHFFFCLSHATFFHSSWSIKSPNSGHKHIFSEQRPAHASPQSYHSECACARPG